MRSYDHLARPGTLERPGRARVASSSFACATCAEPLIHVAFLDQTNRYAWRHRYERHDVPDWVVGIAARIYAVRHEDPSFPVIRVGMLDAPEGSLHEAIAVFATGTAGPKATAAERASVEKVVRRWHDHATLPIFLGGADTPMRAVIYDATE